MDYNENDSDNDDNSSSKGSSSGSNNSGGETCGNSGVPSTSLWIGNVDPSVSEEILSDIFSDYGQLANVRCLPEKYCAFVNYKIKEDASKAMQNLQVCLICIFL